MKAVALQSTSDSGPARKQHKADVHAVPVSPRFIPALSTIDSLVIQRKSACACGGGCPGCKEEPEDLHVQTKLAISTPGDQYEQEADRVADQVMRMTATDSSDAPTSGGSDLRRKEMMDEAPMNGLRSRGEPLPESVRTFFEPRFGHAFGGVRIDTGPRAAQMARAINARAFTVGNYVAFAPGQYAPDTDQGNRLLAHELTHTLQQTSHTKVHRLRLSGAKEGDDEDTLVTETANDTHTVMRAPAVDGLAATSLVQRTPGLLIHRAPDEESLEDEADKITERDAEQEWSATSPGITEQEKPGERFLIMNFAVGQAPLKPEHEKFLLETVYFGTLTSDPMAKIVIVGHADSTGRKRFNQQLSSKRAKAVETSLLGFNRHLRIESTTGKGVDEPIADNGSVFGRARNRAVEILVTPWKPAKPVPELLTDLQKGMKPVVVHVENFSACPFPDTVKSIVEEAFKPISAIRFDWDGKSTGADAFISFDEKTKWKRALGLSGDIFLNSFKNNKICKTPGDDTTCEPVFSSTADVMGRAIANTVAHETGHAFALDHVPATDNYMWSPELHSLWTKPDRAFQEQVLLQRLLQSKPGTFSDSQLVHILNRIKQKRKEAKRGVVEFD